MPKASEIKKNAAVEYDGAVYFVKDIERSVPQVATFPRVRRCM